MKKHINPVLLFVIFAGLFLWTLPSPAANPVVQAKRFNLIIEAIESGKPLESGEVYKLTRGLNRGGAKLDSIQAKKVWQIYEKLEEQMLGQERKKRGKTNKYFAKENGMMLRAQLFFTLFELMNPEHIRAVKAADNFPGSVGKDAMPVKKTIAVDTSESRWHSTGLYAAPGALITAKLPEKLADMGLELRIGCHKDKLYKKDYTNRWPNITLVKAMDSEVTQAANPFGGLVYIIVPNNAKAGQKFDVVIDGAVEAPYFVLGKTSVNEWKNRIRKLDAPWAELENNKIVMTIPSSKIRDLDDPTKAVGFWQDVADAQDDLLGRKPITYKDRFVCDVQISAGALHSGYPIMGHLSHAAVLVDYAKLSTEGTWGWFHELGHNHQRAPWRNPGEVTVNIFSMYSMEKVVGLQTQNVKWYKKCIPAVNSFYENGGKKDQPAWLDGFALPLAMFMQMRNEFGWDIYKKTFREYEKVGSKNWPKDDQHRRDMWMLTTSKITGKDMSPFYDRWGFETTGTAKKTVKHLPKWNPTEY